MLPLACDIEVLIGRSLISTYSLEMVQLFLREPFTLSQEIIDKFYETVRNDVQLLILAIAALPYAFNLKLYTVYLPTLQSPYF